MGLLARLKKGARAAARHLGEGEFEAGDRQVICAVCQHAVFDRGSARLNTAAASLLNLDWANRTAHTLLCANCGHVLWFVKRPSRLIR